MSLTRSEFRLLDTLIRQPGRVFQRSELIDAAFAGKTADVEDLFAKARNAGTTPGTILFAASRQVGAALASFLNRYDASHLVSSASGSVSPPSPR